MIMLDELQNNLIKAIMKGDFTDSLTTAIHEDNLRMNQRLQIYRNHSFITLTQSLKNIYPTILRLVGENFFTATAQAYLAQTFPDQGVLHEFGENFTDFLADFIPAQTMPYLPAVAHFEWNCHQAYYAASHPPLDLARFTDIPPEQYGKIKFKLHPSHRLVAYPFPILRIWQMCQQREMPETPVDLLSGGEQILVIRPQLTVTMLTLSPGEFALITAFSQAMTFTQACGQAIAIEPELQVDLCLQKHLLNHHIVDFSVEDYNEDQFTLLVPSPP